MFDWSRTKHPYHPPPPLDTHPTPHPSPPPTHPQYMKVLCFATKYNSNTLPPDHGEILGAEGCTKLTSYPLLLVSWKNGGKFERATFYLLSRPTQVSPFRKITRNLHHFRNTSQGGVGSHWFFTLNYRLSGARTEKTRHGHDPQMVRLTQSY